MKGIDDGTITARVLNEKEMLAKRRKVPEEVKGRKVDYSFKMSVCGVSGTQTVSVYVLRERDDIILFSNTMFAKDIGLSKADIDRYKKWMRAQGYDEVTIASNSREDSLSLDTAKLIKDIKKSKEDARWRPKFAYTDSWGPIVQKRPCYIKIHGLLSAYADNHPYGESKSLRRLPPNNWRQEFEIRIYDLLTEISRKYQFFYSLARYPDTDAESAEYMRLSNFLIGCVCEEEINQKIMKDKPMKEKHKESIFEKYKIRPIDPPGDWELLVGGEKYTLKHVREVSIGEHGGIVLPLKERYQVICKQRKLQMVRYEGKWLRTDGCEVPETFNADELPNT